MIRLEEIFTKKNIEILRLLANESSHIRDIAKRLGCSPAKVHSSIHLFRKNGLVTEHKEKNKVLVTLNKDSAVAKEILRLLNIKETAMPEEKIPLFAAISPLDYRYYWRNKKLRGMLRPYLSEEGFIQYMARVEAALTGVLAKRGMCSKKVALEVGRACRQVTAQEVYAEEDRIRHNVRALVNCIRSKISDEAKPFVHFTTTSFDIMATADALRYKEFTDNVLSPKLVGLESTLIHMALREKDTLQIGRTHGQHAEPITFGFAIAQYVSRLGKRILKIKKTANDLRGKISGAVGAYNASSLFFEDPLKFEEDVLKELKLKPSPISTQIVEAEYMTDYIHACISAFGILANIADDMRHLQRNEIGEVGEFFEAQQVGSSTMPQKRNPINFENVKSLWKEFMPRMVTVYHDQISEHQRDLTNSASGRFIAEIAAGLYIAADRLNRVMKNLAVDKGNLMRNFNLSKDMVAAEPAYLLLAAHGHPDAHEYVRELTLKSQKSGKPLRELVKKDPNLQPYLKKFTKKQLEIIENPEKYTGIASKKVEEVCGYWREKLKIK